MARYIDADALIEELKSLSITVTGLISGKGYLSQIVKEYKDSILRIIDEQPTADVVPKSEVASEIKDLEKRLRSYETEFKRGNVTIENLHLNPTYKGYSIPKYEFDSFIAQLKKKYTEEK